METEKRLAGFIAETGFADLPQEAINSIKNVVLNLTGATIAGAAEDGCEAIVRQVKDWGGKEESTLLVYGGKCRLIMRYWPMLTWRAHWISMIRCCRVYIRAPQRLPLHWR